MNGLDQQLLIWINHWPDSWYSFFLVFSHGFKWPWFKGILLSIALYLLIRPATRGVAFIAFLAFITSNTITHYLKLWIPFERPCVAIPGELIQRVEYLTESYGTTSAHAANMMALGFVFMYYWKLKALPWVLLALVVGVSRLYFGLHYPSQMIFGFTVGILSGAFWIKVANFNRSRCCR